MVQLLDLLATLPADMFREKRYDPPPQQRKGPMRLFDGRKKNKTSNKVKKHKKRV
jgi:hypothetical protein